LPILKAEEAAKRRKVFVGLKPDPTYKLPPVEGEVPNGERG